MASKNQRVASTVLYSGVSRESGKPLGNIPESTYCEKVCRILRARSYRFRGRVRPGRESWCLAPVVEPVITGYDGLLPTSRDDELVSGGSERLDEIVFHRSAHNVRASSGDFGLPIFAVLRVITPLR